MGEKDIRAISRREFARRAAMASAVASIAPACAVRAEILPGAGQNAAPVGASGTSPRPARVPEDMSKLAVASQVEADGRYQSILGVYGGRLTEEQKEDLRRLCVLAQGQVERLRAYKVENGDGPGLYLKPLFEREKKVKTAAGPAAKAGVGVAAPGTGSRP
jgi:hypothetical protein